MNAAIDNQKEKLHHAQTICTEALTAFSLQHPYQLPSYEKAAIVALLQRMFAAEMDFLMKHPEDYLALYDQ